jgi:hypothetical protein
MPAPVCRRAGGAANTTTNVRSIHDNCVYAYAVLSDQRRIVLHTEYPHAPAPEYTDVIFCGVVANHFEDVLASNILFGVDEVDLQRIVHGSADLFRQHKNYGWPDLIDYRDSDDLIAILKGRRVKAYEISSSLGLNGWVLAGSIEITQRTSKWIGSIS